MDGLIYNDDFKSIFIFQRVFNKKDVKDANILRVGEEVTKVNGYLSAIREEQEKSIIRINQKFLIVQ